MEFSSGRQTLDRSSTQKRKNESQTAELFVRTKVIKSFLGLMIVLQYISLIHDLGHLLKQCPFIYYKKDNFRAPQLSKYESI